MPISSAGCPPIQRSAREQMRSTASWPTRSPSVFSSQSTWYSGAPSTESARPGSMRSSAQARSFKHSSAVSTWSTVSTTCSTGRLRAFAAASL
eukprot:scaffold1590_cov239-Pinguiococcus_pyrenoidosus.AAC.17